MPTVAPRFHCRPGLLGSNNRGYFLFMLTARRLVWAFDVDGCLVDSLTGTSLRPGALEVLSLLREAGATVLLWSAGGRDHAISRAAELGFAHLIDAVYAKKRRGADVRWCTVNLPP